MVIIPCYIPVISQLHKQNIVKPGLQNDNLATENGGTKFNIGFKLVSICVYCDKSEVEKNQLGNYIKNTI